MKRNLTILLFGLIALVTSCAEKKEGEQKNTLLSNFVSITDNEDKGIKEILDFYGGKCKYAVGALASTTEGKSKYFELEMSQSELIESYSNMLELPASNIAYIFYSNLNEEKNNYTHVKVKINLSGGEPYEYSITAEELEEIKVLAPILETTSGLIESQDYEGLLSQFDKEIATGLNAAQLGAYCTPYDSAYGKVETAQFQGYSFFKDNETHRPLVHIVGILKRGRNNTPISLFVDRKTKKVVTMKYEF